MGDPWLLKLVHAHGQYLGKFAVMQFIVHDSGMLVCVVTAMVPSSLFDVSLYHGQQSRRHVIKVYGQHRAASAKLCRTPHVTRVSGIAQP